MSSAHTMTSISSKSLNLLSLQYPCTPVFLPADFSFPQRTTLKTRMLKSASLRSAVRMDLTQHKAVREELPKVREASGFSSCCL